MLLLYAFLSFQREVTDLKHGAVSGKTGSYTCRNGRAKITADCGCTDQHDLGLELIDNTCKSLCIRLGTVGLEFSIIYYDNTISAVLSKSISQILHIMSDQNSGNSLVIEFLSQFFTFADKLQGNTCNLMINLLGESKYTLVIF